MAPKPPRDDDDSVADEKKPPATRRKKQNTKLRRDPQAPKRFRSAFIIFSSEKHTEVRARLGEQGSREKTTNISKLISEEWKRLSPERKEEYEEKARHDKTRYDRQRDEYKGPWKVEMPVRTPKDPNAPKRPMSAYLSFSNGKRSEIKQKEKHLSNAEVSKLLSNMWRDLPNEERQKYVDEEFRLRQEYRVAIAEFQRQKLEDAEKKSQEAINEIVQNDVLDEQEKSLAETDGQKPTAKRKATETNTREKRNTKKASKMSRRIQQNQVQESTTPATISESVPLQEDGSDQQVEPPAASSYGQMLHGTTTASQIPYSQPITNPTTANPFVPLGNYQATPSLASLDNRYLSSVQSLQAGVQRPLLSNAFAPLSSNGFNQQMIDPNFFLAAANVGMQFMANNLVGNQQMALPGRQQQQQPPQQISVESLQSIYGNLLASSSSASGASNGQNVVPLSNNQPAAAMFATGRSPGEVAGNVMASSSSAGGNGINTMQAAASFTNNIQPAMLTDRIQQLAGGGLLPSTVMASSLYSGNNNTSSGEDATSSNGLSFLTGEAAAGNWSTHASLAASSNHASLAASSLPASNHASPAASSLPASNHHASLASSLPASNHNASLAASSLPTSNHHASLAALLPNPNNQAALAAASLPLFSGLSASGDNATLSCNGDNVGDGSNNNAGGLFALLGNNGGVNNRNYGDNNNTGNGNNGAS